MSTDSLAPRGRYTSQDIANLLSNHKTIPLVSLDDLCYDLQEIAKRKLAVNPPWVHQLIEFQDNEHVSKLVCEELFQAAPNSLIFTAQFSYLCDNNPPAFVLRLLCEHPITHNSFKEIRGRAYKLPLQVYHAWIEQAPAVIIPLIMKDNVEAALGQSLTTGEISLSKLFQDIPDEATLKHYHLITPLLLKALDEVKEGVWHPTEETRNRGMRALQNILQNFARSKISYEQKQNKSGAIDGTRTRNP